MLHKNIPNNNKDIIRFLAKNFAGTKKVRNAILFCSVVIGIVAITMVFGISFGKIQAEEIQYPDSLSPASYLHTDSDWFSDVGRTESRIYRES